MDCVNGVCNKPMSYFENFKNDLNLKENILYLSLTPVIYFAILIMLEEKFFTKLFTKIRSSSLQPSDKIDEEVKREKDAVTLEISKITSQSKILQ